MATRFSSPVVRPPYPVVRRGQVPLTQEDLDAHSEVANDETERDLLADL
jgi:hypothetical protein